MLKIDRKLLFGRFMSNAPRKPNQLRRNSLLARRESVEVRKIRYFDEGGFLIKPIPTLGASNDKAFLSISAQILESWEIVDSEKAARTGGRKRTNFDKHNNPPFLRPQNFTKRCIYELGCAVFDRKLCVRLEKFTKRLYGKNTEAMKVYDTAPSSKTNPFAWGYLMVFGVGLLYRTKSQDNSRDDGGHQGRLSANTVTLTRDARYKASRELLYAYKHKVPTEYLVGFISQSGGHERIIPRANNKKLEEWYKRRRKMTPIKFH